MSRSKLLIVVLAMFSATVVRAAGIDRIEPPCWWVGMNTDLQY